jgi:hypothetical protein
MWGGCLDLHTCLNTIISTTPLTSARYFWRRNKVVAVSTLSGMLTARFQALTAVLLKIKFLHSCWGVRRFIFLDVSNDINAVTSSFKTVQEVVFLLGYPRTLEYWEMITYFFRITWVTATFCDATHHVTSDSQALLRFLSAVVYAIALMQAWSKINRHFKEPCLPLSKSVVIVQFGVPFQLCCHCLIL